MLIEIRILGLYMIKVIKKILPKDKKYHLALSMGVDSVAALFWLKSKNYDVIPIHFNHNLRAQNGIMHEKFLNLCEKLNLENKSEIWTGGLGKTESDCRKARLDFYSKIAKNGTIITAHHIDDWIENYLLNCFRGHPTHRPFELESKFENFKIIHPFLLTRKKDFKEFLERNNWNEWVVEDQTNGIIKGSRRNWIRNELLPKMIGQKLSLEKYAKRKIEKFLETTGV